MRAPLAVLKARIAARRSRRAKPAVAAFDGFISYSHAADGELAKALQGALHRFARPWYRLRAVRVFRDEANLATDPDLWGAIEEALLGARHLILLASPEAARSQWVAREVATWTERHGTQRLLLVVTAGELAFDPSGSVDWDASNVVPRTEALTGEPRYLDLRPLRGGELTLRNAAFREAVADLAAPLHGRAKDELIGDDVREHRRARRLARGAVGAIGVLAVLASVAALVAVGQRNEAQSQLALATSRYLASQAKAVAADQRSQALLLALEAMRIRDTPEARDALLSALLRTPNLRMLLQPEGSPRVVAVSPDGDRLAAGTTAGTIEVWDWETGRSEGVLRGSGDEITELAFAPRGDEVLAATVDGRVRRWDLRTGEQVGEPIVARRDGGTTTFAVDRDGELVATGNIDGELQLWDVASGHPASEPVRAHPTGVTGVAFEDGGTILAGGQDGRVTRWRSRLDSLAEDPLRVTDSSVWGLDAQGGIVAAAMQDGTIGTVDQGFRAFGEHRGQATTVSVDPTGVFVASGGFDNAVRLWDARSGKDIGTYHGHIAFVSDVAVAPAGRGVASAGADGVAAVWDLRRPSPLVRELEGRSTHAVWGPRGQSLFTVRDDGGIVRWEGDVGEPVIEPRRRVEVTGIAVSPDGRTLAVGTATGPLFDKTGAVELWDIKAGTHRNLSLPAEVTQPFWANHIEFSPDGGRLVAGGLGTVLLWSLEGRSAPHVLKGDVATFSPDGATLAATTGAPDDGTVRLWDAVSGHKRDGELSTGRAAYVFDVAFSPDGASVAAGDNDGTVVLWDARTRRRIGEPLTGFDSRVDFVQFAPDGRTLAATSSSEKIRLWQLPTRQPLGTHLTGHGVAFSPDGATLAAPSSEGGVRLWSLDVVAWRRAACALAGRNLGATEWAQFVGGLRDYEPACPGRPRGRPATPAASAD